MDLEDLEVCLRYILTLARRRSNMIFEIFSTKEKKWPLSGKQNSLVGVQRKEGRAAREVAKRSERRELRRNCGKRFSVPRKKDEDAAAAAEFLSTREEESQWSSQQRAAMALQEKAWKESRGLEEEDKRKRCVTFEGAAKRMLENLEDSEELKVTHSDVKEQLETPEEAGFSVMQIAKQARHERGQKLFEIFRQGGDMRCTSTAWRGGTHN